MEEYIVKAEKMVFGGNCLGKIDGKVIFIPNTIPEELLKIRIIKSKRDYDVAEIISILEPSPYRRNVECVHYEKCGGCNLLHIDSEYQKKLREMILKELFLKEKIDLDYINIVSDSNLEYRCRMQIFDGGLKSKHSNNIVAINDCLCATPQIRNWLKKTEYSKRKKGKQHIFADKRICIENNTNQFFIAENKPTSENQDNLVIGKTKRKIKNKVKKHFYGTLNSPETVCTVELSIQHEESLIKKRISFDIRGFFQSNLFVLEKAISQIYKYISNIPTNKKRALDFYSGAGTFSVFLADFFENITLVEHNRDALVYAEQNLIKTKHTSYGVSGEFWVQQYANKDILQNGNYDLVIIDPPRSGIEKPVIDFLCKSNIPRIISISCDPATHARDCAILMKAGYKIKQMYLLDFYPNTSHIESMAFLEK